MSETRTLLSKIASLRQRLEQTPGDGPSASTQRVEGRLKVASHYGALFDGSFRQLAETAPTPPMPNRLTARAHRLLEMGQGLLVHLRQLGEHFPEVPDPADTLAARYRETVSIADTALRMVQAYPDSPSVQLRLCEGLEGTLVVVAERIGGIRAAVAQRQTESQQVATLTELLRGLDAGKSADLKRLVQMAETLLADASECVRLRLRLTETSDAPVSAIHIVVSHSLNVAQVMARLVRHDPDLRGQAVQAVLAALIHDVGMLRVPNEIVTLPGSLNDAQRRVMEAHVRTGADQVARLLPDSGWLAEATACHHERLDGTGYPLGLRDTQIPPLARLLAVCDVYAALCAHRPHRAAHEPRTALTDTLLLADKGSLDRSYAERLLHLSFYPVGSVVELADGAIGIVVATHAVRQELNTPARPVVALLTTPQGQPLPMPRHLDLAECDGRSIVRAVPASEGRALLGKRYAELA
ncbi:MAG: HD domain-containing protein [Gemmataceae bacterium]|nr:HD domain-containing protein [Gemmataceae bacterium]